MSFSGKKPAAADDEIDQLLREAQDELLLKLNLNSHTARGSSSAAIHPDLDRRFRALRNPQMKSTKVNDPAARVPAAEGEDGGDLFARFAALKRSIPSHGVDKGEFGGDEEEEEDEEEEDEVEKVMRWAADAARLDPSPPSDEEDDDDDDEDDDGSDDDSERGKKGKRDGGKKGKRK